MKQIEYGKWYSVNDCMPEDFKELIFLKDSHTADVVILYYGDIDFISISFRNFTGSWEWFNKISADGITHWMAIPKLEG